MFYIFFNILRVFQIIFSFKSLSNHSVCIRFSNFSMFSFYFKLIYSFLIDSIIASTILVSACSHPGGLSSKDYALNVSNSSIAFNINTSQFSNFVKLALSLKKCLYLAPFFSPENRLIIGLLRVGMLIFGYYSITNLPY